jgi:transketolase
MRMLPNMTVVVPCDAVEAERATIEAAAIHGPVYLRLGRSGMPVITKETDEFRIGKANVLRDGRDLTIFACGQMVYESMLACDILAKEGVRARLVNIHTPKPLDADAVMKAAYETGAFVTAEEHTIAGGLGSAIAEAAAGICPVPIKMVGIRDRFGVSGEAEELFEYFGLTPEKIASAAREALRLKR